MAESILDAIHRSLSPQLAAHVASRLGESPAAVTAGLGATVPALLVGLLDRGRDPEALQTIFDLVRDPANDAGALADPGILSSQLSGGTSLSKLVSRFLDAVLGTRGGTVVGTVAEAAGLPRSSATSLLTFAATLVLGALGERVKRDGLGAPGLLGLVERDRDRIFASAPSGLAGALGHASLRDIAAPRPAAPRAPAKPVPARRTRRLTIALAFFAALALWRIFGSAPAPEVRAPAVEPPPVAAPAPAHRLFRHTLPGGYALEVSESGVERSLVGFLDDPSRAPDETSWFDFDRLLFETGSATLAPASRAQLRDVAEILKAYPTVRVKIGGYTDATGDPTANLALSAARAARVRSELIELGIAPERVEAEGYGDAHPVASNDTEEGRARNRRIALRVTAR